MTLTPARFARLIFEAGAEDPIEMAPFKGSMLRGALGTVFRMAVCVRRSLRSCSECTIDNCPYRQVFESSDPDNRPVPRPFVIEPPDDDRRLVGQGESFEFGVVLFGRGLELALLFVMLFDEAGKLGIGRGRGRFSILRVRDESGRALYTPGSGFSPPASRSADEFTPKGPVKAAEVRFTTPAVIRKDGSAVDVPSFEDIVDCLMRRLKLLYRFHSSERIPQEVVEEVLNPARLITIRKVDVQKAGVTRFSARQGRRISYWGFAGSIHFAGDMTTSYAWLKVGEYLHMGKGCTFGLGRFEVR